MHPSASIWIVLLGAGVLSAAPPGAAGPSAPPAANPQFGEAALPTPRAVSRPAEAIVEEAAPPPREQALGPPSFLPPGQLHEEAAPMPREQTPSVPRLRMPAPPRDPSLPDVGTLHREIELLRLEREAMLLEEMDLITARDVRAPQKNNEADLRRRVTVLLAKVAQRAKQESAPPPPAAPQKGSTPTPPNRAPAAPKHTPATSTPSVPSTSPAKPPHPSSAPASSKPADKDAKVVTDAPVDPYSLAQSLFQARDFAAALNVYRKLEQEEPKMSDRVAIQYMMACCLRKLGKSEEASVLYREVANSGGNEFLLENAQWYLRAMKERRTLESQLEELRQRRQALLPRKPKP